MASEDWNLDHTRKETTMIDLQIKAVLDIAEDRKRISKYDFGSDSGDIFKVMTWTWVWTGDKSSIVKEFKKHRDNPSFEVTKSRGGNIIRTPFTSSITNENMTWKLLKSIDLYQEAQARVTYSSQDEMLKDCQLKGLDLLCLANKLNDEKLTAELISITEQNIGEKWKDEDKQDAYMVWIEKFKEAYK